MKEVLLAEGVSFPEGAEVFFGLPISGFGLRNTEENHRITEAYLDRELAGEWSYYSASQRDPIPNDPFSDPPAEQVAEPDA